MQTVEEAKLALLSAWPFIKSECLGVLGSELHYQAMIYHCLRAHGDVPIDQLGMNVKMWISEPITPLFRLLDEAKHEDYRGGFEPIPDVVIFKPQINGDWRRRNKQATVLNMLIAIEVKASERRNKKLSSREIQFDIDKLAAHRDEVIARGADMLPVMLIIDSARSEVERMTPASLHNCAALAKEKSVAFMYVSPTIEMNSLQTI